MHEDEVIEPDAYLLKIANKLLDTNIDKSNLKITKSATDYNGNIIVEAELIIREQPYNKKYTWTLLVHSFRYDAVILEASGFEREVNKHKSTVFKMNESISFPLEKTTFGNRILTIPNGWGVIPQENGSLVLVLLNEYYSNQVNGRVEISTSEIENSDSEEFLRSVRLFLTENGVQIISQENILPIYNSEKQNKSNYNSTLFIGITNDKTAQIELLVKQEGSTYHTIKYIREKNSYKEGVAKQFYFLIDFD